MTALHLAACSSLYRIVHKLIAAKADLFIANLDGKTALTGIGNNLLMMKIIKKAMINTARGTFEDC